MPLGIRFKKNKNSGVVIHNLNKETAESYATIDDTTPEWKQSRKLRQQRLAEAKKQTEETKRVMAPLYEERNENQKEIDLRKEKLKDPKLTGSQILDLETDLLRLRDKAGEIEQKIDGKEQELKKQ